MPYEPPKYPGAIPTAEDLPDRDDDVDWLYAARYNELKKELRAALIELGTDPAGTFATVKARLDDMLPHFHDRGDPSANDFTQATLTVDGAWHDMDLSSIVPVGTKAVLLGGLIRDDAVGNSVMFRENGNTNAYNVERVFTQVANVTLGYTTIVACDTNRVIEYRFVEADFDIAYVNVKGWWK